MALDRLQSGKEFFWYFLQAENIEVRLRYELECSIELSIAPEHIPRVNFHELDSIPRAEFFAD
jgi:hypothetical protein